MNAGQRSRARGRGWAKFLWVLELRNSGWDGRRRCAGAQAGDRQERSNTLQALGAGAAYARCAAAARRTQVVRRLRSADGRRRPNGFRAVRLADLRRPRRRWGPDTAKPSCESPTRGARRAFAPFAAGPCGAMAATTAIPSRALVSGLLGRETWPGQIRSDGACQIQTKRPKHPSRRPSRPPCARLRAQGLTLPGPPPRICVPARIAQPVRALDC